MDKTVGIIGLGIMGGAIARNLAERGWRVIGFDIETARCTELAPAGIDIASDVTDLSRRSEIIKPSLPSPAAAKAVAEQIAASATRPRIVVDLSTLTIADKITFEKILRDAGHTALD